MTPWIEDVAAMDWSGQVEWPEGFQPLDAIVLVKGVYDTEDGSLSRPMWWLRCTVPLGRNVYERIGALETMLTLAQEEAVMDYDDCDGHVDE